jgi:serine phosphatase RsbU (regulator of sigma subunit)
MTYIPNVVSIFLYLYFFTFLFKQNHIKYEQEIHHQKDEIAQQKEELHHVHKQITDSVRYAKRIQTAMLPPFAKMNVFAECFIFYQPKDIVSGDFYWFSNFLHENRQISLIACVDCTGHGVPGALMTMVGNALLNQIVNEKGIIEPAEILKELDKQIISTLQQEVEGSQVNDGMDMGICMIDKAANTLKFAGSKHNLFLFRNQTLEEIHGSRSTIGGDYRKKQFLQNEITLQENDTFYLSTDGYADQFGGYENKRFNKQNFKHY